MGIQEFLAAAKKGLLLDVRSPAEYNHAHLPGAVSLPLFTDEERAVVGTAYKQESRQKAIKLGLDFFGPKMRGMVEEVEELLKSRQLAVNSWQSSHASHPTQNNADTEFIVSSPTANCPLPTANSVFIYCWRGGMRSGAVAWLLNLYGFEVSVLAGGYKAFRRHVLEALSQPYTLNILGGYTGSGKTELLQTLKQSGEAVIDLEKLARHKGSAFGKWEEGIQPSQEMFENCLALELLAVKANGKPIWVEDESQRIGRLNIPALFWQNMRQSPIYFLDIPFEQRLEHIVQQYGRKSVAHLIECTERIAKRLGGLDTKNTIAFLQEGNLREAFRILLRYYDKTYAKGLHSRENLSILLRQIQSSEVRAENVSLLLAPYQPT